MLKELPKTVGVKFDTRLRSAIYEFGKSIGAGTMSDTIRSLIVLGLERASSIDSSVLKAGYRTGVNRGIAMVEEKLHSLLDEEMTRIDATDDLTTE